MVYVLGVYSFVAKNNDIDINVSGTYACVLLLPADVEMKVVYHITYVNDGLVTEDDGIINKVFSFLCICRKSTQNEISRHES